jgi:hypothetical protein
MSEELKIDPWDPWFFSSSEEPEVEIPEGAPLWEVNEDVTPYFKQFDVARESIPLGHAQKQAEEYIKQVESEEKVVQKDSDEVSLFQTPEGREQLAASLNKGSIPQAPDAIQDKALKELAKSALQSMSQREGEDKEDWAKQLATDLSKGGEAESKTYSKGQEIDSSSVATIGLAIGSSILVGAIAKALGGGFATEGPNVRVAESPTSEESVQDSLETSSSFPHKGTA